METLKMILVRLTKLSRELHYMAETGGSVIHGDTFTEKKAQFEILHEFAHELCREVAPGDMIVVVKTAETFNGVNFSYNKYQKM